MEVIQSVVGMEVSVMFMTVQGIDGDLRIDHI
jgi:hypothetical protein